MTLLVRLVAGFLAVLASCACRAEPGRIVIGQTAGFTGSVAGSVNDMTLGARLVIDDVNARGGIKGQTIELVALDDGFDVKRAVANTQTLITEKNVVAMFLNRGTPHTQAMLPVLAKFGVPLIAPSTGALSLHEPPIREVFNVRATYQVEAERSILQLASMGVAERIGVIHVDDSYGRDALAGALRGFDKLGRKPLFVGSYDRVNEDMSSAVAAATRRTTDGHFPAVLFVGANSAIASAIKQIRKAGSRAYMATLSSNASSGFIKALGPDAEYVMVSQVYPPENAVQIPLIKDTRELLKRTRPDLSLTPAMLEGASAARLLVAALNKCPTPITPKRLMATLESGASFDIGWPQQVISYSATDHTGIRYADTAIIAGGKFRR